MRAGGGKAPRGTESPPVVLPSNTRAIKLPFSSGLREPDWTAGMTGGPWPATGVSRVIEGVHGPGGALEREESAHALWGLVLYGKWGVRINETGTDVMGDMSSSRLV